MKSKKIIIAVTSLGLLTTALANAQTTNPNTQDVPFAQRIIQSLTDAQKNALEQAKKLFESGKKDEAKALLESNGIKHLPNKGEHRRGKMGDMHGDKKSIHDAIASGNYTLFLSVASSSPLKGISQDVFNQLTPHFQAKKNAQAKIKSILETAGIKPPQQEGRNKQVSGT